MQRLADPPVHLTDLLPSLFCCGHTSTGKELRICTQRPLSGSRSPCLLAASCSIASHGRSTPSWCHFGNATNKHLVSRVASACSLTFLQDTKITEPVIKTPPSQADGFKVHVDYMSGRRVGDSGMLGLAQHYHIFVDGSQGCSQRTSLQRCGQHSSCLDCGL